MVNYSRKTDRIFLWNRIRDATSFFTKRTLFKESEYWRNICIAGIRCYENRKPGEYFERKSIYLIWKKKLKIHDSIKSEGIRDLENEFNNPRFEDSENNLYPNLNLSIASEICLAKNPRIRIHSFISKENSRILEQDSLEKRYEGIKIIGKKIGCNVSICSSNFSRSTVVGRTPNGVEFPSRVRYAHADTPTLCRGGHGVKFDSRVGAVSQTLPDLSRPDRKLWIRAEG